MAASLEITRRRSTLGHLRYALVLCTALVACSKHQENASGPGGDPGGPFGGSGGALGGFGGGGEGGDTGCWYGSPCVRHQLPARVTEVNADAPREIIAPLANVFVDAMHDPFSTFTARVQRTSYEALVAALELGMLPDALPLLRIEDVVNAFDYVDPAPASDAAHAFHITLSAAPHPFGRGTELLRVSVKSSATLNDDTVVNVVFVIDALADTQQASYVMSQVMQEAFDPLMDLHGTVAFVGCDAATPSDCARVIMAPTPISDRERRSARADTYEYGYFDLASGAGDADAGVDPAAQSALEVAFAQIEAVHTPGSINHVVFFTDQLSNQGDETLAYVAQQRNNGIGFSVVRLGTSPTFDLAGQRLSDAGGGGFARVATEPEAFAFGHTLGPWLRQVAARPSLHVELNPSFVKAHRLIGYERYALHGYDDARADPALIEVPVGHAVTALYEIVRVGQDVPLGLTPTDGAPVAGERRVGSDELARVTLRYQQRGAAAGDPFIELAQALPVADVLTAADANEDFMWSAAMATLGEALRGSPYADAQELDAIEPVIAAQAGRDAERTRFHDAFVTLRRLLAQ